ncbi:acyl-CoA dehydrogenase family protein [Chloroflexota bacterium]
MDFELTPEQQQLEREIHDYLKNKVLTPEIEEELEVTGSVEPPEVFKKMAKQLGTDGWLGIGWPKEYGGQERSAIEQYIFYDIAMGYYKIPFPMLAVNTVGPTIMKMGTDEQKKRFLPAILKGGLHISVGYTEPEAGSDLASLKTRAVRDGDYYIINGQKSFTTQAQFADYVWLAARTDQDAPKHKGISVFLIDLKTPGIAVEPLWVYGGHRTNYTFYEDVRVPKDCLIGEENRGWRYITNQLGLERISLVCHSQSQRFIEDITRWAKETKFNGAPVIEQPWVRNKLVEMVVDNEVLKLFNYRVAWLLTQGITPPYEPAMIKVFGAENVQRVLSTSLQIMGLYGQLHSGSKWAPYRGKLEQRFMMNVQITFGGGAVEILRDMIAMVALGLPRSR